MCSFYKEGHRCSLGKEIQQALLCYWNIYKSTVADDGDHLVLNITLSWDVSKLCSYLGEVGNSSFNRIINLSIENRNVLFTILIGIYLTLTVLKTG